MTERGERFWTAAYGALVAIAIVGLSWALTRTEKVPATVFTSNGILLSYWLDRSECTLAVQTITERAGGSVEIKAPWGEAFWAAAMTCDGTDPRKR